MPVVLGIVINHIVELRDDNIGYGGAHRRVELYRAIRCYTPCCKSDTTFNASPKLDQNTPASGRKLTRIDIKPLSAI